MSNYTVRKAQVDDKARIMDIYAYARKFMAENGNPNQWKNNNPREEVIDEDIKKQELYVIEDTLNSSAENGEHIHGVFYFHIGEDATYNVIENGEWLSDELYGTIHRIAGDGTVRGILGIAVAFCEKQTTHLRIDTHKDNKIMQHVILKNGFSERGTIYVKDGSPRIAYEKVK